MGSTKTELPVVGVDSSSRWLGNTACWKSSGEPVARCVVRPWPGPEARILLPVGTVSLLRELSSSSQAAPL
jgi:hypothetical protein